MNPANPGPAAAIRGLLDAENNARISLDVGLLGCRAVLIRCGSRHRRFFPALLIVFRSQHVMRRSTCFDLYKLWSASLLTDARHRAWKKLEEMSRDRRLLKEYSDDNDFIYNFSQIEHFFVDLRSLIRERMICPKLARTLFADSTRRWLDRLEPTIYADQFPYSFHYGRTAEEARHEFLTEILPLRGILKTENCGTQRPKPTSVPAD
jgi:hypothetical protein